MHVVMLGATIVSLLLAFPVRTSYRRRDASDQRSGRLHPSLHPNGAHPAAPPRLPASHATAASAARHDAVADASVEPLLLPPPSLPHPSPLPERGPVAPPPPAHEQMPEAGGPSLPTSVGAGASAETPPPPPEGGDTSEVTPMLSDGGSPGGSSGELPAVAKDAALDAATEGGGEDGAGSLGDARR